MDTANDFTVRLQDLLRRERADMADFLVALADFDRRRLWLDLGYSSLFDYLHRELGLSKASAFFRKRAAELVQRFPDVVAPLRDGRLCLTSVVELGKVLTDENRHDVLPRFFQLSKREAKAVSAAIRPDEAPVRREVVTTVRTPAAAPGLTRGTDGERRLAAVVAAPPAEEPPSLGVVRPDEPSHASSAPRPPSPVPGRPAGRSPVAVEPLTAELNRLHVTVPRRFLEKLEKARAVFSHSHPGASADEILEAGLDLLLERHARRQGLVKNPRPQPRPSKPDHAPAHVRRTVWARDGGKCQWPVASGGICGSTLRVEIDHRVPRARGGPPTIENLRCLCEIHNDLAARAVFGDAWMDRFTRGRGARGSVPEPETSRE